MSCAWMLVNWWIGGHLKAGTCCQGDWRINTMVDGACMTLITYPLVWWKSTGTVQDSTERWLWTLLNKQSSTSWSLMLEQLQSFGAMHWQNATLCDGRMQSCMQTGGQALHTGPETWATYADRAQGEIHRFDLLMHTSVTWMTCKLILETLVPTGEICPNTGWRGL